MKHKYALLLGFPGSVHDARVFKNSPIAKKIDENPLELFPSRNCHILADSAYKCTNYVLTPYRDNGHLNRNQKKYNYKLSATRVCIEQAFGLLKGRFRILKFVNIYNTELVPKIVLACCVLHNICMARNDVIEINGEGAENVNNLEFDQLEFEYDVNGNNKRIYITETLM